MIRLSYFTYYMRVNREHLVYCGVVVSDGIACEFVDVARVIGGLLCRLAEHSGT